MRRKLRIATVPNNVRFHTVPVIWPLGLISEDKIRNDRLTKSEDCDRKYYKMYHVFSFL